MTAGSIMPHFGQQLTDAVKRTGNSVCVGLDPRADQLPEPMMLGNSDPVAVAAAYQDFCYRVIDSVADLVPVVKPQAAFFEALGPAGTAALAAVNKYASDQGLLVVLDAKRGDIGSTAEAYADAYLKGPRSPWSCHALTVNPFLGDDTLEPMVDRCRTHGSGIFVLVKTSNPGSSFVQSAENDGTDVSHKIAGWVQTQNESLLGGATTGHGPIGAVVGATYPQQLRELREAMPNAWLLIPGYGAQGGTAVDLRYAWQADGLGAIVNSSRGIIFAYRQDGTAHAWTDAVRRAAIRMIDDLKQA